MSTTSLTLTEDLQELALRIILFDCVFAVRHFLKHDSLRDGTKPPVPTWYGIVDKKLIGWDDGVMGIRAATQEEYSRCIESYPLGDAAASDLTVFQVIEKMGQHELKYGFKTHYAQLDPKVPGRYISQFAQFNGPYWPAEFGASEDFNISVYQAALQELIKCDSKNHNLVLLLEEALPV